MSYDAALGINTPFLNQLLAQISKAVFQPQEKGTSREALVANANEEKSTGEKIKELLGQYMPPVVSLESPNMVAYFAKGGQPTVPDATDWPDTGIFLCISPATTEAFANTVLPIGKDVELEKFDIGISANISANSVSGFAVNQEGFIGGMVDVAVNDITVHAPIVGSHNLGSFSESVPVVLKPSISDNKLYIELEDFKLPEPNLPIPGILKHFEDKIFEIINDLISDAINWIMSKVNPVTDFGTIEIMDGIGVNISSLTTAAMDSYLLASAQIEVVKKEESVLA